MYCGDEVAAVIGDIGSFTSKFGYAGEDSPKIVIPSTVGIRTDISDQGGTTVPQVDQEQDKNAANALGKKRSKYVVGDAAVNTRRDNVDLKSPFNGDAVSDWGLVEELWSHAYNKLLSIKPEDHPVVASVRAFDTLKSLESYSELMFEKFNAPAIYLARDAVLSTFAYGRSTALVVDAGASSTRVVPVQDGYALQKGTQKSSVGGRALDEYLHKLLTTGKAEIRPRFEVTKTLAGGKGPLKYTFKNYPSTTKSFVSYARLEVVRDIKESTACMPAYKLDEKLAAQMPPINYELPDGTVVAVGVERYRVAEALMNCEPLQMEGAKGLADLVHEALQACDPDIRRELLSNIILTGGSSCIEGTPARLVHELGQRLPATFKARCTASGPVERRYSTWVGGSVLASLGSFQQLWLSREEFQEKGVKVLEERFC